jgi:chromosome segregation ATPase
VIVPEEPKPRAVKPPPSPRANPQARKGRRVEEVEKEIASCENQLADLTSQLSRPAADWTAKDYAEIGRRQEELQAQLESLYREWETVTVPTE